MTMHYKNPGKIESIFVNSNMWLINFINVWLCVRKRSLIYITPFSLFIFDYNHYNYFGLNFLKNEINSFLRKFINFDSLKTFAIYFATKNIYSITKIMKDESDFLFLADTFVQTHTIQNFKQ